MREIKFRVFDKLKKQMCDLVSINFKTWDEGCPINYIVINTDNGHEERLEHEVSLMQYIGLKDKNGKEIYKGDIIKFYNENFIVTWSNQDLRYTLSTNEITDYCFFNSTNCEIIGNEHENPELLENKK